MKVPEDKTVPARVGWVVRKQCVGVGGRGVDCGFRGHKRRVQLYWTCSHLGKATLRSVPQLEKKKKKKKDPLSKQCAGYLSASPSEIQSSWV